MAQGPRVKLLGLWGVRPSIAGFLSKKGNLWGKFTKKRGEEIYVCYVT